MIEFDTKPSQIVTPNAKRFSSLECEVIDSEIEKLLGKSVIKPSEHEIGEFISSIFVRPKKDATHRMILNLKSLNKHVNYYHFKMDTLSHVLTLDHSGLLYGVH